MVEGYIPLADTDDLIVARAELENLYSWLADSPVGTPEDLHGLDTAITTLRLLVEKGTVK